MLTRFIKRFIFKVHACSIRLITSEPGNFHQLAMSGDCKPSVLFVLGAPGSGKGTQCSNIVEKFKFEHLSAGDLLRMEKNTPGSPFGSLIEEHIKNGTIVPAQITCSLLERAMRMSRENYFLIDGFPRNKENIDEWEKEMSGKVNLLGVLFFECQDDVCVKRCLARGAAGSGRSDDNEDSLRKRFQTYQSDTMPIVKYFISQKLAYILNSNRNPNEIFADVEVILKDVAPLSCKN